MNPRYAAETTQGRSDLLVAQACGNEFHPDGGYKPPKQGEHQDCET
jgi:hypothetical protein